MIHHHRFRDQLATNHSPNPAAMPVGVTALVVCPLALMQWHSPAHQMWQNALYQMAFEQAMAANRPSWPERDLLAVWN
jgi:hypothetical protein